MCDGTKRGRGLVWPALSVLLLVWLAAADTAMSQGIEVTDANPPSAEQGSSDLEVLVTGSGFAKGAQAHFFVTGTADPGGVSVKSSKTRGSTKLVAKIDVASDATVTEFDIEVENNDGRRGKGIELFGVSSAKGLSGTIHYAITYTDSPLRGQWTMDPAGNDKTQLPEGVKGEPSAALHGGLHWLLHKKEVIPKEFYPLHLFANASAQDDLEVVSISGDPDPDNGWGLTYTIQIDGRGNPDSFEWWCGQTALGCPEGGQNTGIPITGGPQELVFGDNDPVVLTILFEQTTGHEIGDSYNVYVTKRPRQVLLAVREDGGDSTLITNPLMEPLRNPRWSDSDGLVTWVGQIWDNESHEAVEAGIFGLDVVFDADGVPQPDGEPVLLVDGYQGGFDGDHSTVVWHSPSPDGTEIVFDSTWLGGLEVTDVLTQVTRQITDFGDTPDWSPSGEMIVFEYGPYAGSRYRQLLTSIWTVRPDGSDLVQLVETTCRDRGGTKTTKCVESARWSPGSTHVLYSQRDIWYRYADVYRMLADGRGVTNLTKGLDEEAYPVAWCDDLQVLEE